ncbi:hypothetical protein OTERR_28720 [Oryzomicrobium terrae]|uniref:Glycosyltransferase family 9 protein n=1 Tax=Oryzomicrobium terrae TaxID=1735038 RepID=A0A5C1EDI2_9RHOO|nr:glycosyltransferase family 9 protein [Oryzomicrobium terrae]QEL66348.1 hypothetical protein OTERR_28720 [Oryzomicrobium terrae]
MRNESLKILVIRRDNIGDLICTTPLFAALRQRYPDAYLAALVNSYNAPAIAGNPHLDAIHAYTKGKHAEGETVLGAYWRRAKLLLALRQQRFDYVVLASAGYAKRALGLARIIKPRHVVGFVTDPAQLPTLDVAIEHGSGKSLHETEDMFRLLAPLGVAAPIPPLHVVPDEDVARSLRTALPEALRSGQGPLVALHISARKPPQRWPVENFAALARRLHAEHGARFLLFWSPGDEKNPFHPGDDGKAAHLQELMAGLPVAPVRTEHLSELIAGLSLADAVVCSDGGAMHVAAGLGKPIVCFFGNSDANRWHPWGVPYQVLQTPSHNVVDITPEVAAEAFASLLRTAGATPVTVAV